MNQYLEAALRGKHRMGVTIRKVKVFNQWVIGWITMVDKMHWEATLETVDITHKRNRSIWKTVEITADRGAFRKVDEYPDRGT